MSNCPEDEGKGIFILKKSVSYPVATKETRKIFDEKHCTLCHDLLLYFRTKIPFIIQYVFHSFAGTGMDSISPLHSSKSSL